MTIIINFTIIESRDGMSDFFKEMYKMGKAFSLKEVLNVCSPFALNEDTYEKFYVNTNEARGEDASKKIILRFKYNGDQVKKILFMGHNGSGKSTELFKIQKELEKEYLVVKFSIKEETDTVNNFAYSDLIFAILNNIFAVVSKNNSYNLSKFNIDDIISYWNDERVLKLVDCSKIDISSDLEAKVGWFNILSAKIKGVFQTGVEAKQEIRRKMEPTLKQLLIYINKFIAEINTQIAPQKLLLIIEDLDKLIVGQAKELFVDNRKTITALNVNTIYTFPIYLFYSEYYNEILSDFDSDVLLSMIKVNEINGDEFSTGIETLKKIVAQRCDLSLFSENSLEYMIKKSGGSIRDLFWMVNNAALNTMIKYGEDGKISKDIARQTYYEFKSRRERIIKKAHLPILQDIYKDKTKKPFGDDQDLLMQLLHSMCVIEYNGKRWCDLHPAIKDYLIEKGVINETTNTN